MLELEWQGSAQGGTGGSAAADEIVALLVRLVFLDEANDASRAAFAVRSAAVGKVDRVRHRMVIVRGEAQESLPCLDVAVGRGHQEVRDSSRDAVGRLQSRVAEVFKQETVRL